MKIRRWHIRRLVIWTFVLTLALGLLLNHIITTNIFWLSSGIFLIFAYIYGWYDLKKGFENDDPVKTEYDDDMNNRNDKNSHA